MHKLRPESQAASSRAVCILAAFVALWCSACGRSAMSTCGALEKAGVARGCHPGAKPVSSAYVDVAETADFEMVRGGEGHVYLFANEEAFRACLDRLQWKDELETFVARSKHGVGMNQGYVKAKTMVLLSDEATIEDEDATRVELGQDPSIRGSGR